MAKVCGNHAYGLNPVGLSPAAKSEPYLSPRPALRVVPPKNGFTIVELVTVLAIVGILAVLIVPLGTKWLGEHRLYSATNLFVNGATVARLKAISGAARLTVTKIEKTSTLAGMGGDGFHLYTGALTFYCDHVPTDPNVDLPITKDGYVSVEGFNQLSYLNNNVFRVGSLAWTTPPVSLTGNLYQVSGLNFIVASCREGSTSNCLKWTDTTNLSFTAPLNSNWKAWGIGVLNFKAASRSAIGSAFGLKQTTNTVECLFDKNVFQVQISDGINPSPTTVTETVQRPIVFDLVGNTKDYVTYTVVIYRLKGGVVIGPPAVFRVMPSGRVVLGVQRQ